MKIQIVFNAIYSMTWNGERKAHITIQLNDTVVQEENLEAATWEKLEEKVNKVREQAHKQAQEYREQNQNRPAQIREPL